MDFAQAGFKHCHLEVLQFFADFKKNLDTLHTSRTVWTLFLQDLVSLHALAIEINKSLHASGIELNASVKTLGHFYEIVESAHATTADEIIGFSEDHATALQHLRGLKHDSASTERYQDLVENVVNSQLSSWAIMLALGALLEDQNVDSTVPEWLLERWSLLRQFATQTMTTHREELDWRIHLALIMSHWDLETARKMVHMHGHLRDLCELRFLSACARRWPNFKDHFLPHANRVLIDRHSDAVIGRTPSCSSLRDQPFLTREDLTRLVAIKRDDQVCMDDEEIRKWVFDDSGSIRIGSRTLREHRPGVKPFLLSLDDIGLVTPRKYEDESGLFGPNGAISRHAQTGTPGVVTRTSSAVDGDQKLCPHENDRQRGNVKIHISDLESLGQTCTDLRRAFEAFLQSGVVTTTGLQAFDAMKKDIVQLCTQLAELREKPFDNDQAIRTTSLNETKSAQEDKPPLELTGHAREGWNGLKKRRPISSAHSEKTLVDWRRDSPRKPPMDFPASATEQSPALALVQADTGIPSSTAKDFSVEGSLAPTNLSHGAKSSDANVKREELINNGQRLVPNHSPNQTPRSPAKALEHVSVQLNWARGLDFADFITMEAFRACQTVAEFFALIEAQLPDELRNQSDFIKEIIVKGQSRLPEISSLPRITRDEGSGRIALRSLAKRLAALPLNDIEIEFLVLWSSDSSAKGKPKSEMKSC